MKSQYKQLLSLLTVALLLGSGCSEERFDFPKGDPGVSGISAYQLWKNGVADGSIDWPRDAVDMRDFMLFQKAHDGKNGATILDLFKEYIQAGNVPNPHNPSETWPKDAVDERSFWEFVTGKDGAIPVVTDGVWTINGQKTTFPGRNSANGADPYEVWKNAVKKGEIEWDANALEWSDYLRFLKGSAASVPSIGEDGYWYIGQTPLTVNGEKVKAHGTRAYDMWVEDVKANKVTLPDGTAWPADKTSEEDMMRYLAGKNGEPGDSAYEVWKQMVEAGEMPDPRDPNQKWSTTDSDLNAFYKYLCGKDGAQGPRGDKGETGDQGGKGDPGGPGADGTDGKNGKSAYEIWKEDLKARCGTPDALKKKGTNEDWPCDSDSRLSFYEFIEGAAAVDGADGADGTAGANAQP